MWFITQDDGPGWTTEDESLDMELDRLCQFPYKHLDAGWWFRAEGWSKPPDVILNLIYDKWRSGAREY